MGVAGGRGGRAANTVCSGRGCPGTGRDGQSGSSTVPPLPRNVNSPHHCRRGRRALVALARPGRAANQSKSPQDRTALIAAASSAARAAAAAVGAAGGVARCGGGMGAESVQGPDARLRNRISKLLKLARKVTLVPALPHAPPPTLASRPQQQSGGCLALAAALHALHFPWRGPGRGRGQAQAWPSQTGRRRSLHPAESGFSRALSREHHFLNTYSNKITNWLSGIHNMSVRWVAYPLNLAPAPSASALLQPR